MKIKTNHVPDDCDYLTNNKIYDAVLLQHGWIGIDSDDGLPLSIDINECEILNGEAWEIVEK